MSVCNRIHQSERRLWGLYPQMPKDKLWSVRIYLLYSPFKIAFEIKQTSLTRRHMPRTPACKPGKRTSKFSAAWCTKEAPGQVGLTKAVCVFLSHSSKVNCINKKNVNQLQPDETKKKNLDNLAPNSLPPISNLKRA